MDSTRAISEALRGLVTGLAKSLQEFQDVEKSMLEVEAAAAGIDRNGVDEPGRALIAVAGTVKEMVGAWVSDLNTNAQVQKLMAAAGEHHGDPLMNIPKHDHQQSSDSLGGTLELCNYSRAGERARGKGLCKHSCEHHQEVVDPRVWRKLPQEMVELVFAKLPLDAILGLCSVSVAWRAMSRSSNFCGAFSARFSELFEIDLFGSSNSLETKTTIYDVESKKWFRYNDDRVSFPMHDEVLMFACDGEAYQNSMFACDGGLVCFVPVDHEDLASSSVLVGDPSYDYFRALPLMPLDNVVKETIMVQLVVECDTRYKVIVELREKIKQVFSAHFYHRGEWCVMESGLVYGGRCRVETGLAGAPSVFDCETKVLHDLRTCEDSLRRIYAPLLVRDGMFVLHAKNFSKYTWDSTVRRQTFRSLLGIVRLQDDQDE